MDQGISTSPDLPDPTSMDPEVMQDGQQRGKELGVRPLFLT